MLRLKKVYFSKPKLSLAVAVTFAVLPFHFSEILAFLTSKSVEMDSQQHPNFHRFLLSPTFPLEKLHLDHDGPLANHLKETPHHIDTPGRLGTTGGGKSVDSGRNGR